MSVTAPSPQAVAEQLIAFIQSMMKSSQGPVFELATKFDLTLSQLKILMMLSISDRPLALNEIAERSLLSLPATGRAVDALLKHDLVSRREDEVDRRVKRVALTENGVEATDRVVRARLEVLTDALTQLTDAQRTDLAAALEPLTQDIPDCKP